MPKTLQRSLYHAADRQTLRHCVALVHWEHGEYSTHYEVHPEQAGPAHSPRPVCYYHQGDYFPTLAAARVAFAHRADVFEGRYWKHLEAPAAGPTGQPHYPAAGDRSPGLDAL